jgi:hypothetical protein
MSANEPKGAAAAAAAAALNRVAFLVYHHENDVRVLRKHPSLTVRSITEL